MGSGEGPGVPDRQAGRERGREMVVVTESLRKSFGVLTDDELRDEWAYRCGVSTWMVVGDALDAHLSVKKTILEIARERGLDLAKGVR